MRSIISGNFKIKTWLLSSILLYIMSSFNNLSAQEIDVTENITYLNITPFLLYFEDKSNHLCFEEIVTKKLRWTNLNKDYVNFGYTQSVYWFKINIINRGMEVKQFLLEIDFPTLDKIEVFRQNSDKTFSKFETGDTFPFEQREFKDHNFIFDLKLPPGTSTLYLKINNFGSFRFRTLLYQTENFIEIRGKILPLLWLLYGSMVFIFILFMFLFLFSTDRNYLYFSLFTLLLLMFQLTHRGFAFKFLWPDWPWWTNVCSPITLNLMASFGGLFYCSIMETQKTSKRIDYFLKTFAYFIFPINAIISLYIPLYLSLPVTYYLLQPMIIFLILWTIYYVVKGIRFAKYFILGILNVGFFTIIGSLTALGKLPSTVFTEWSTEFGFVGLVLFSSLGILDRIMNLNRELIDYKAVIDHKNQELEATNEELQAAMEELESANEELERQYAELEQSQEHLLESEQQLRDIFNATHDALIIHTDQGLILEANARMLEMYKLKRDDIVKHNLNIADLSAEEMDMSKSIEYMKKAIRGENPVFVWKAIRPLNKTVFDVEIGLKKLIWKGQQVILASVRDITDRVLIDKEKQKMQSQLLQAQKMEALGTLAGGIAHDFNNMLGGIIGSLSVIQLLINKDPNENKEKIIHFAETALESSRRAAEITKQLLTLSRKTEVNNIPVDINQSLKHVLKLCQNSFPKSIELDFKIQDKPLMISADPVQIEQVIINLCVNASHAMTIMRSESERHGGVLKVDADIIVADEKLCAVHPKAELNKMYARVTVKDTGVGIPESILDKIFDPFFTTKKMEEGTGLGLSMVYGIVTQYGGFISVESRTGEGSIFTLYLPALKEHEKLNMIHKTEAIIKGEGTILIIDDEKTMTMIAKEILEECGYEVIIANDGWKGVQLFRDNFSKINAIVLDLSMPGVSGLEILEEMQKINSEVKVLMASGYIKDVNLEKALAMGVKGILHKPYSAEELSKKIHDLFQ